MSTAKSLLFVLRLAGFKFYVDGGRLFVEPPAGDSIGDSLRAQLEQHHDPLLEILAAGPTQ